jgi:hypothetical protein
MDFWLPVCLLGGNYNVCCSPPYRIASLRRLHVISQFTLYESSHINGTSYFTITPIPVVIFSPARVIPCTNWTNEVMDQPQVDARPSPAPYDVEGGGVVYTISDARSGRASPFALVLTIAAALALGMAL